MAWRDSRSQRLRLVIFSLAIVAGVASLTAIHSLKASVEKGIASEAKSLLGSDLRVASRSAFTEEEVRRISEFGEKASQEMSFPSVMKFLPEKGSRLMQMRGISGGFPFYGEVATEPAEAWERMKKGGGVVLEPAILEQFSQEIGDRVEIGGKQLEIYGVVTSPAPQGNRFSGFSPEAYLSLRDLKKLGLIGKNSLVTHQVHLTVADGESPSALKKRVQEEFDESRYRAETPEDRQEQLGKALGNFQTFLSLIALASLVLGAIGVAGAVHAHITKRIPTIAILRCLGSSGNLAFAIYLAQAIALGLLGALIGMVLGITIQMGLLQAFGDQLPISVSPSPEWATALRTGAIGFLVCCGFALLPLLKISKISPAATLRSSGDLGSHKRWATVLYLIFFGLLLVFAVANDADWKLGLGMMAGLGIAFLILTLVAKLLMWVARKTASARLPYLVRQGILNLHRPGNQTLLFMLSLGLGTFLLVTILSTQKLLSENLDLKNNENSPNLYLIDVQADQVAGVEETIREQGLEVLESTPMVTMRVKTIRGELVKDLEEVPKWVSRREFRSTYRSTLNDTEILIEGELATERASLDEVVPLSLEEGIAEDMKVRLGDEIVLDIQGIEVRTKVTSIRRVDWGQFNLNFFMVFPPGVLEDAPGFHVVTTKAPNPESSGELQGALAKNFANVTPIDLAQIVKKVRGILEKISLVITILAGFSLLAGLPIFFGTLLNGRDVRLKESVLLRTLGASASQVRKILAVEYLTLGFLASLTGVLLGAAAYTVLAVFVFESSAASGYWLFAGAVTVVTALSLVVGLLLSRGVSREAPLAVLRNAG